MDNWRPQTVGGLAGIGQASSVGVSGYPNTHTTVLPQQSARATPKNYYGGLEHFEMLAMRMRWNKFHAVLPFGVLTLIQSGERVFVTVLATNTADPVILEDTVALFPSDTLITQLRLLEV